ncbi:HAMP domain-containing sensor histidine kinase [Singulisphaera sp. Ch08]|uniref:histidine kinase n=1 Tax=Singulisphaera sp. Ch08 TaxID=3120278 RepID=A0AAU7CEK4_9BACT
MTDNKMTETTERLNNLGHLSAGVGHHVINAFSAIVSNAELLRMKTPMPLVVDPVSLADTIVRTALEAATVARRLIDYTRPVTSIDTDNRGQEPSVVALDRLAEDFVSDQLEYGPSGVDWITDLAPTPLIRGHSDQLRAMLGHLISNAYDAMPNDEGTVWLSTSTDTRGWVVLELRDSGQGMESETMVRAVEPFFSSKNGHLGVGLSIANGIWRRHRGTLSLRSQPGEGTVLRLCVEPYQG